MIKKKNNNADKMQRLAFLSCLKKYSLKTPKWGTLRQVGWKLKESFDNNWSPRQKSNNPKQTAGKKNKNKSNPQVKKLN